MDNRETLYYLISNPQEVPSTDWVEYILAKYPYFVTPAILMLERGKETLSDDKYESMLHHVALNVANRRKLNLRLANDDGRFTNFYPQPKPMDTPDTTSTIDKFLDRFGKVDDKETKALENAIFNPVPEYGLTLDDDDDTTPQPPKDNQDALIASFLEKNPVTRDSSTEPATSPEPPKEKDTKPTTKKAENKPTTTPIDENASLTESLANVYIKQKRYAKAYDILLEVSRQSGHHNPHIADQLRFLQKLIKLS